MMRSIITPLEKEIEALKLRLCQYEQQYGLIHLPANQEAAANSTSQSECPVSPTSGRSTLLPSNCEFLMIIMYSLEVRVSSNCKIIFVFQ